MKTLRFIGIALLTVLMSVGSSSCSKSDDDNGGGDTSASIEGIWYEMSVFEYELKDGEPDFSKLVWSHDYSGSGHIWTFAKTNDGYNVTSLGNGTVDEYSYVKVGNNEYKVDNADKVVILGVSSNTLELGIYENFYKNSSSYKAYTINVFKK